MNAMQQQPRLIRALMQADVYPHAVEQVELIETHISWVLLTGDYVYKIKKPVNFGFLDFSTLDQRHVCCKEELRLNRRLAPSIYLDVVSITGSPERPHIAGSGPVIEYAVKMAQFPQQNQLDHMHERGELTREHMDAIARMVADFHSATEVSTADDDYGTPAAVYMPVAENFSQIRQHVKDHHCLEQLKQLESWSQETYEALAADFQSRKQAGFIRECHGDMHLRNLVWYQGSPVAFDCIEFNPAFRWIDVISEIAFLVMDLQDRAQYELAQRFLNRYLEITGDYNGVELLPFYCCYRAMVRAKVAALRLSQPGIGDEERQATETEFSVYLRLADGYANNKQPALIVTRGMSASGKSTISLPLLEKLQAIRIRSDVERKRLFGVAADTSAKQAVGRGMYSADVSRTTYQKLAELSAHVLDAGYRVIVDAANLKREQRAMFQQLAASKNVAYIILDFVASEQSLRDRITKRRHDVSDADMAVLEHQMENYTPLDDAEKACALVVDTDSDLDISQLAASVQAMIEQKGR